MMKAMDGFKLSLVGKFLVYYLNIEQVKLWVDFVWTLKGSVSISAMSKSIFLFSFVVYENMLNVLMGGLWPFDVGFKNFLLFCKWKPDFDPSIDLGAIAPTWIHLLGLPLEFQEVGIFKGIANSFRSLLVVKKITQEKYLLVIAQICVKVVVNNVLPTSMFLKSKFGSQSDPLEYENARLFCQPCKKLAI